MCSTHPGQEGGDFPRSETTLLDLKRVEITHDETNYINAITTTMLVISILSVIILTTRTTSSMIKIATMLETY